MRGQKIEEKIMKKKLPFILILMLCFSMFGATLFFYDGSANAVSQTASVWDGKYVDSLLDLSEEDYQRNIYSSRVEYHIYSARAFAFFSKQITQSTTYNQSNAQYLLEVDVDLNGYEFSPIGTSANPFQGAFYGQKHQIHNLKFSSQPNVGLFAYAKGATIEALQLTNFDLSNQTSSSVFGGIVADASNVSISNCVVDGKLKTTDSTRFATFGGMLGKVAGGAKAKLENLHSSLKINLSSTNTVGGIIGSLTTPTNCTISGSSFNGTLAIKNSSNVSAGGIVGSVEIDSTSTLSNNTLIQNCFVNVLNQAGATIPSKDIKGIALQNLTSAKVGGLIGSVDVKKSTTLIKSSYFVGNVGTTSCTSTTFGGFVGQYSRASTLGSVKSYVYDSFVVIDHASASSNNAECSMNAIYKISDANQMLTQTNVYYYVDSSVDANPAETREPNLQLLTKSYSFYEGDYWSTNAWDSSIWGNTVSSVNNGYLYLLNRYNTNYYSPDNDDEYSSDTPLDGEGTASAPYIIRTAGDLGWLSVNYTILKTTTDSVTGKTIYGDNTYFALANDISLLGKNFVSIGSNSIPFSGVFDGNNHSISGLTCSLLEARDYHGLFAGTANAVIKNLTVENSHFINGDSVLKEYGTIVGKIVGTTYFINCKSNQNYEYSDPTKEIPVVGIADPKADVYVIYGLKNCDLSYRFRSDTFISSREEIYIGRNSDTNEKMYIDSNKLHFGYDIPVYCRGGIVYREYDNLNVLNNLKEKYQNDPTDENFLNYQNEFTKALSNIHIGDYRLLLDKNGKMILQDIDESYEGVLPSLSNYFAQEVTMVRPGYKNGGFRFVGDDSLVSKQEGGRFSLKDDFTICSTDIPTNLYVLSALKGIYADWQAKTTDVTIYYNAYEKASFNSKKVDYGDSSLWKVDASGRVYVTKSLPYDSFFADCLTVETPKDAKGKKLRNGDFEVEGLYKKFDDSACNSDAQNNSPKQRKSYFSQNVKLDRSQFLNDEVDNVLYANWTGTDRYYALSLNINTPNDDSGKLSVTDAIQSVSFVQYSDQNEVTSTLKTISGSSVTSNISFRYNTLYSDSLRAGFGVSIKLKAGYSICYSDKNTEKNHIQLADTTYSDVDKNFGTYVTSQSQEMAKLLLEGNKYSQNFFGLVGDWTGEFYIKRDLQDFDLSINGDMSFTMLPSLDNKIQSNGKGKYTIKIYDAVSKDFVDTTEVSSFLTNRNLSAGDQFLIGFDIYNYIFAGEHNLMTTDKNYDLVTFDTGKYFADGKLALSYSNGDDVQYFMYEKISVSKGLKNGKGVALYKTNSSLEEVEWIASVFSANGVMFAEYYTKSNFNFAYSTKISDSMFTVISPEENAIFDKMDASETAVGTNPKLTKIIEEENDYAQLVTKKAMTSFKNLTAFCDNYSQKQIFELVTIYTKAVFNFVMVNDKGEKILEDPPTSRPRYYDAVDDQVFSFDVVSSDYYKYYLKGTKGATLFGEGANWSLKVEVKLPNTTVENYENKFNANNTTYLQVESVEELSKTEDQNSGYRISLRMKTDFSAGGYTCYVVCTGVNYQIETKLGFVYYSQANHMANDSNSLKIMMNNVDELEQNTGISLSVTRDGKEILNSTYLSYGDKLSFATSLGDVYGYSFLKWVVKDSNGEYLGFGGTEIEKYYYELNDQSNKLSDGRFNVTMYAVYEKKSANIELANYYYLDDYNNKGTRQTFTTDIGLDMQKSDDQEEWNKYYFSTSDSIKYGLDSIKFSKDDVNGVGYYFAGYVLLQNGKAYLPVNANTPYDASNIFKTDTPASISLYDTIKYYLKNDSTLAMDTMWTVVPVLKQKTATIRFYSGAGESDVSDGLRGRVFDEDGNEKTNNVYVLSGQLFESVISFNTLMTMTLNGASVDVSPAVEFASREGYRTFVWKVAKLDESGKVIFSESLTTSALTLAKKLFAVGELDAPICVYKEWDSQTSSISFNANGGVFLEKIDDILIKFNNHFSQANTNAVKQISAKTSYLGRELVGWEMSGEKIFETDGTIVDVNKLIFDNGDYVNVGNVTVYAMWQIKVLSIEIDLNGGDKMLAGGEEKLGTIFSLEYDSLFDKLTLDGETYSLDDLTFERAGFVYDGLYLIDGKTLTRLYSTSVFDVNLPTFDIDTGVKAYVRWKADSDYFDINFASTKFENTTYNGNDQTYYLSQLFTSENLTLKGFEYDFETTKVDLSQFVATSSTTELNVTIDADRIGVNQTNKSFTIKNAGGYSVKMAITVTDKAPKMTIENNIYSQTIEFSIFCQKANIDSDISAIITRQIKLKNIQRMMQYFVPVTDQTLSASSFSAFVSAYAKLDSTITKVLDGVSEDEAFDKIYQYLVTKYYLMIQNDGTTYREAKEWTYQGFVDSNYLENNATLCSSILKNSLIFDFYQSENESSAIVLDQSVTKYGDMNFTANGNSLIGVGVSKVVMANNYEIRPNTFNYLRVYFTGDGTANYNFIFDAESTYLEFNLGYMFPEIVELSNVLKNKRAFYNENLTQRQLTLNLTETSLTGVTGSVYKIDALDLFVQTNLFTSNGGSQSDNVEFGWTGNENYIYFDQMRVFKYSGETLSDVTSNYRFILSQDDVFTILGTKGMVKLNLFSRYRTITNAGYEINDLDSTTSDQYIKVTSVTYQDELGASITITDPKKLVAGYIFEVDGNMIYEITKNPNENLSICVTNFVTSISLACEQFVGDEKYIAFNRWSENSSNTFVTTDKNPSYTNILDETALEFDFDFTKVDQDEIKVTSSYSKSFSKEDKNSLFEIDYFAFFTDLVEAEYNLNFKGTKNVSEVFKLGFTTQSDMYVPVQEGFSVSKVVVYGQDGVTERELDYIFIGSGKTFKGLNVDFDPATASGSELLAGYKNRHQKVMLKIYWTMDDVILKQLMFEKDSCVGTLNSILASEVVEILNQNSKYFSYTYSWNKLNGTDYETVATGAKLSFINGGTFSQGGKYRLSVTAKVLAIYESSIVDDKYTKLDSVDFDMNFIRYKVTNIAIPGQTSFDYDGKDHKNDVYVDATYDIYDNTTRDYSSTSGRFVFETKTTNVSFEATLNGVSVTEIKNAGQYLIKYTFDDDYFEVDESLKDTNQYLFEIVPIEFDLKDVTGTNFEKAFASADPDMSVVVGVGGQNVKLLLSRDAGEDLGEYNVYLLDTTQIPNTNINYLYNGAMIFENGELTEAGKTTAIGKFVITQANTLELYYDETEDHPKVIEQQYNVLGYSYEISTDPKIKIRLGGSEILSIDLKLYDGITRLDLSGEHLDIIKSKLAYLQTKLYYNTALDTATDCAQYSYQLSALSELSKYYSTVKFRNGYALKIYANKIDFLTKIEKTYDGTSTQYFELDGTEIDDISAFSGVYVLANYTKNHVGDNIKVYLSVNKTAGIEDNLANYSLKNPTILGKIVPMKANLNLSLTQDEFEFGIISKTNLSQYVKLDIRDQEMNDVNGLLQKGYYSIDYSLPASAVFDADGYVYKNSYEIVTSFDFVDFYIQNTPTLTLVVGAKTIDVMLENGFIVVEGGATIEESYTKDFVAGKYTFSGEFYPVDTDGNTLTGTANKGDWELKLKSNAFKNDSIIVNLLENKAFKVASSSEVIYARLNDETILNGNVYNKKEYVLSADASTKTLNILQNGSIIRSSKVSFFTKNGATETAIDLTPNIFEILTQSASGATDAGLYRLKMTANFDGYSNSALFEKEIYLEILPKTIDVSVLDLTKTYDKSTDKILTEAEIGQIESLDAVTILVQYENSQAGTTKGRLFLQGLNSSNYKLSKSDFENGQILKASATLTIKQKSFTYGEFSTFSDVEYLIISDGANVSQNEYEVSVTIVGAVYSSINCLEVGSYDVNFAITSTNYEISYTPEKLTISAYVWNLTLSQNGGKSVRFDDPEAKEMTFVSNMQTPIGEFVDITFERESGDQIGYYRVIGATLENKNYTLTVTDSSSNGYFEIAIGRINLYMLLSEENELEATNDEVGTVANLTYDTNTYDRAIVGGDGKGGYVFELYSSISNVTIQYKLSAYTYDDATKIYTKFTTNEITNLKTTFVLADGEMRNVGIYKLQTTTTSSDNFPVVIGQAGKLYNFYVKITPKGLLFDKTKSTKLESDDFAKITFKEFDNKASAVYYLDASEILTGFLGGETASVSIELLSGENLAKYVGDDYTIKATLSGSASANYTVINKIDDDNQTDARGAISRANLDLFFRSRSFVYGQVDGTKANSILDITPGETYKTKVDLTGYDWSRLTLYVHVSDGGSSDAYSTTGYLKAGTYGTYLIFSGYDFQYSSVTVDDVEYSRDGFSDDLMPTITIMQKSLTLKEKSMAFKDIFTKTYDGTTSVKVSDGTEQLIGLDGIVAGDIVNIASADYEKEIVGSGLVISFTLGGADKDNYSLDTWDYGEITPITLKISFDYYGDDVSKDDYTIDSNVDRRGLQKLSSVAFPFATATYLTSNSTDANTNTAQNFPSELYGYEGHSFSYWTMVFKNLNNTAQSELTSLISRFALQSTYDDATKTFKVRVDNSEKTVKFLQALVGEENSLGYYFKDGDGNARNDIEITFVAKWGVNSSEIEIKVVGEDGKVAKLATVELDTGAGYKPMLATMHELEFDQTISIKVTPNDHCYWKEFHSTQSGTSSATGDGSFVYNYTIKSDDTIYIVVAKQKVDVIVDTNGYKNVAVSDTNFIKQGDNFVWNTDYFAIENMALSSVVPKISNVGYDLLSVNGSNDYSKKFSSFITSTTSEKENITLTLEYSPVDVNIILDYGYEYIAGQTTKTLTTKFGSAFETADGWEESPTRTGYEFVGWSRDSVGIVDGSAIVDQVQDIKLSAIWSIKMYVLKFVAENCTIEDASITLDYDSATKTYKNDLVEFEKEVSFKVTPGAGWEVSSLWGSIYDVSINDDGSAYVTFKMPAGDVEYQIPIVPKKNKLTFLGDNVTITVTGLGGEIELTENIARFDTGDELEVKIEANLGYSLAEDFEISDENVVIENKIFENNTLTFTLKNLVQDTTITLTVGELRNEITLNFDESERYEKLIVDGMVYSSAQLSSPVLFTVLTGHTLEAYVKLNHGYDLGDVLSPQFAITKELVEDDVDLLGCYHIVVTNINQSGQVNIGSIKQKFNVSIEVVAFDENRVIIASTNKAFATIPPSDEELLTMDVEYLSSIKLSYVVADKFSFVGWSLDDGATTFTTDQDYEFVVENDQKLVAIFSRLKYTLALSAYDYYFDDEGLSAGSAISLDKFKRVGAEFQSATGANINPIVEVYYGSSVSFIVNVPNGYIFNGYGFASGDSLKVVSTKSDSSQKVLLTISSLDLNDENVQIDLRIILKGLSKKIKVRSYLELNTKNTPNLGIGELSLVDENYLPTKSDGYVTNSKVHYDSDSIENGSLKDKTSFDVIAFSKDEVYVRVDIVRSGYVLKKYTSSDRSVLVERVDADDFIILKISNIVGGDSDVELAVVFEPYMNIIDLAFRDEVGEVYGGSFVATASSDSLGKVWTSGREYGKLTVSAYTDSSFDVTALIKGGYRVDPSNITIEDEQNIVDISSVTYQALSYQDCGYNARITFKVSGYLANSKILLSVVPVRYKVLLKDSDTVLAKIDNVAFGRKLDLTDLENITVYDLRLSTVGGRLQSVILKDDYNFEGYFTHQKGAGVRYIDSNGDPLNEWQETGYDIDERNGKYLLDEDAYIDEDGSVVVSLYIYWSYLKTRISFEFVPGTGARFSAQDMISGIDWSNSWFYEDSPNYIEVSFNTDIYINAPEIYGFGFFKFVISQKNSDGVWLSDAVAYTNSLPWSTNEFDRIVECNIKIVYFAQVDVQVFGGVGDFRLIQNYTESQAKDMLDKGYADTSKTCAIEAVPSAGYSFVCWEVASLGEVYSTQRIDLGQIKQKTNLLLKLSGMPAKLSFEEYEVTYGQITNVQVDSKDKAHKEYVLGRYANGNFYKTTNLVDVRVGDVVTMTVKIDRGFAVSWNRKNITFDKLQEELIYDFKFEILPDDASNTISIVPTFRDEILSIFVSAKFADSQVRDDALDLNIVSDAGKILHDGEETSFFSIDHGRDIVIDPSPSERYYVSRVFVENYGRTFDDLEEFYRDDMVILSKEYISDNNFIGNIKITIEYSRKMWIENDFEPLLADGTNRYKITSVEDLALMMKLVNSGATNSNGVLYSECGYSLQKDLMLDEKFWTPIGTFGHAFNGEFDFNQHKITGIYLAYAFEPISYNGLFGVVGARARIVSSGPSLWYIYVIISIFVFVLILVVLLIIFSKRRKEKREEMAKKN